MKYQIYYCIDINSWYIDLDDGLVRPDLDLFNTVSDTIDFFLQHSNCFLNSQKECLNDAGQYSAAKENVCWLETYYFIYKVNQDKTWTCTTKSIKV